MKRDGYIANYFKDSALLVFSITLTNVLFMATQCLLGRTMDPVEYAALLSLLGVMNVLGVPSSAIQAATARFVAEHSDTSAEKIWVTIVKRASKKIFIFGLIFLAIWCAVSGMIRDKINAPSIFSVILLGEIGFISLFSPLVGGTLQGARRFGVYSMSNIATALARLLLCVAVVFLFKNRLGLVLGAVALSSLLGIFVGYVPFHGIMVKTPSLENYDTSAIYRYFFPVLIGQGALFLMVNADMILMRKFLDPENVTAYGKAAILSRMIVLFPMPMVIAMFPRAVVSNRRDVLLAPLCVAFCAAVLFAVFVHFFPWIPLYVMFGIKDPLHCEILSRYIWAVIPLPLLTIVAQYLWARNMLYRAGAIIPVALIYLLILRAYHGSPNQMILCLSAAGVVALAVTAVPLMLKMSLKPDAGDTRQ